MGVKRVCQQCGKEFFVSSTVVKRGSGKFCSVECSNIFRRGKPASPRRGCAVRICETCGKEFIVPISRLKIPGHASFCSMECTRIGIDKHSLKGKSHPMYGKRGEKGAFWGKHHTDEHKKRMSQLLSGENNPMYGVRGEKHPRYGIKHTHESIEKMVESHKNIALGENNGNWKGGISFEPYCPKFNKKLKEDIRNKYGRRCVVCGIPEFENVCSNGQHKKLSVHHVTYDKQEGCNGKDVVLVPLCIHCHSATTTGDRDYWQTLLLSRLNGLQHTRSLN